MTTISNIIEHQTELLGLISRAVSNTKKKGKDNITATYITARIDTLESNWNIFQENHSAIYVGRTPQLATHEYFTKDVRTQCEDEYVEAKVALRAMLDALPGPSTHTAVTTRASASASGSSSASSLRTLPRINLPQFSGLYSEWTAFRDLFSSLVLRSTELSLVEIFHYLKTSLSGEAAQLIGTITVNDDNFERAWSALTDRFENKRALTDAHLDSLFSLQRSDQESSIEIKRLLGIIDQALGALRGLGCQVDAWDPFLIYWISRHLDPQSIKDWELTIGNRKETPAFKEFKDFLAGRIRGLESIERMHGPSNSSSNRHRPSNSGPVRTKTTVKSHQTTSLPAASTTQSCVVCNESHYIASCPKYLDKTLNQRRELVIEKSLCFNCLGHHRLNACRSTKRCRICRDRHHTSIHRPSDAPTAPATSSGSTSTAVAPECSPNAPKAHHASSGFSSAARLPVLLATARVIISSSAGETCAVRALLDQGSEVSFIKESLVQLLHLPRCSATLPVKGMGERRTATTRGVVRLCIGSHVDPCFMCEVNAFILPRLTDYGPSTLANLDDWPHLQIRPLADPDFLSSRRIDLVIGADLYGRLLKPEIIQGEPNTPTAQNSHLGWVISGPSLSPVNSASASTVMGFHCNVDTQLDELLRRFWTLDEPTTSAAPQLSHAETECEHHFQKTHSRDTHGRYCVRLPLARDPSALGESRTAALRMLRQTEERLEANSNLKCTYHEFLKEYEQLGHMRLTSESEDINKRSYYLPHHIVIRDAAPSSKARVVFNGSHPTSSGISLNDCLMIGPKLQTELADVILRWRRHAFVFAADIEKMYRQILVHPEDQALQRILWRDDEACPVSTYNLTTVTYGLACAPYLALRTLRQLLEDEGERFPLAVDAISCDTYVDDILSGANDVASGQLKIQQIISLLKAGGFNLKKWVANDDHLLRTKSDIHHLESSSISLDVDSTHRALGLSWNPHKDVFLFSLNAEPRVSPCTKRNTLSQISKLFDPLGWLAPITVRARIFMQEIWSSKSGWDDQLPLDFCQRWARFLDQLPDINQISIPRWLGTSSDHIIMELHGFSDASSSALGIALYLRVLNEDHTARCTLLMAKTKVAPLKRITIPRLELSAALMLSRHAAHVKKTLTIESTPVHLWTDSSVTLAWIRSDPTRWKEFVHNRVMEIKNNIPEATWHHVRSEDNPADLASRGTSPQLLSRTVLWWEGPEWLKKNSLYWPSSIPLADDRVDIEARKHVPSPVTLSASLTENFDLITRYSSLTRLLRITAWCFRAIKKWRKFSDTTITEPLTPSELDRARLLWVEITQREHFSAEVHTLKSNRPLNPSNSLAKLMPFLDEQGLLRVGGRLKHSLLDPDHKHPLVLPKHSHLSSLVIHNAHSQTLHGGAQLTLNTIRRSYWIIGGRSPIRMFINRCVVCVRNRARTCQQQMGQLPTRRVTPSRPFLHSDVDYAGPMSLRTVRGRGAKTYKGYIAIFVCFATSAVHLEMVTDYTTDAFIAAYKRFCGRRGICATLTSDCGTNFIGADAELRRLFSAASRESTIIASSLTNSGTQWIFNPPSAPHFGGMWEAAVKSVKFHLRRVIGDTSLTFEEYTTLLAQIEAALNSRPLCPLSDDVSDLAALTPGHFLTGDTLNAIPTPGLSHIHSSRLSRWQLLQKMLEHFWQRWSTEYLHQLQAANKWLHSRDSIQVGSLVLIKDDRLPPTRWPLARVIELHPGRDNKLRVVTLRTATNTLKRPVVKLCLLPITPIDT